MPLEFWVVIGVFAIIVIAWIGFFFVKKRIERHPFGVEKMVASSFDGVEYLLPSSSPDDQGYRKRLFP